MLEETLKLTTPFMTLPLCLHLVGVQVISRTPIGPSLERSGESQECICRRWVRLQPPAAEGPAHGDQPGFVSPARGGSVEISLQVFQCILPLCL